MGQIAINGNLTYKQGNKILHSIDFTMYGFGKRDKITFCDGLHKI